MEIQKKTHWPASSGSVEFSKMEDSHILYTINYVKKKYGANPGMKKPEYFYIVEEAKRRGLVPEAFDVTAGLT